MTDILFTLLRSLSSIVKTGAALQIEIVALRHQVNVLRRSVPNRPRLRPSDRLFWTWLSCVWPDWRSALVLVKPETVVAWHRKAFRFFWTWKSRHGRSGRPSIPKDVRELIRSMSKANPLWGAPRVHGEILKLGIELSQTTVAKYLLQAFPWDHKAQCLRLRWQLWLTLPWMYAQEVRSAYTSEPSPRDMD